MRTNWGCLCLYRAHSLRVQENEGLSVIYWCECCWEHWALWKHHLNPCYRTQSASLEEGASPLRRRSAVPVPLHGEGLWALGEVQEGWAKAVGAS